MVSGIALDYPDCAVSIPVGHFDVNKDLVHWYYKWSRQSDRKMSRPEYSDSTANSCLR